MAANIRCIMRAKAPYGQGITKMKVKLTPEQSSTPSLMPETNSVYLSRPTEGTGELMELVGGSVAWNQPISNANKSGSVTPSGSTYYSSTTLYSGVPKDHVFLLEVEISYSGSGNDAKPFWQVSNSIIRADAPITHGGVMRKAVVARQSATNYYLICGLSTGSGGRNLGSSDTWSWVDAHATDLTAMFGSTIADYLVGLGSANAVAWLQSYGFFTEYYYAYSAPTLQSVEATAHVTKGKNLLPALKDGTYSGNGVAAVVTNGVATFSGTTTSSGNAIIIPLNEEVTVPTEQCYLHFLNSDVQGSVAPSFELSTDVGNTNVSFSFSPANRIVAVNQNRLGVKWDRVRFYLSSEVTLSGTFSPMLMMTNTATEYSPYHAPTTYPLDSDLVLRGIPKLSNGNLYYDGDTYEWDGTVTRNYGTRAYQAGDESLTDAITDGTNTVYKLTTPTTESADPYTAVQTVEDGGTEEFVTTNNVPVGVVGRFANAVPMEGVDSFSVTANDGTSHTYPVTLSEEIYRGYVDMLTGEAVSDMASIAEYNGETISEPWLSSLDVYSAGATPTNGAQVVYPITPEEVTATITGDPSELSGVVSATSTEGTVEWSELSEIGIKCIMKRKNPFQ